MLNKRTSDIDFIIQSTFQRNTMAPIKKSPTLQDDQKFTLMKVSQNRLFVIHLIWVFCFLSFNFNSNPGSDLKTSSWPLDRFWIAYHRSHKSKKKKRRFKSNVFNQQAVRYQFIRSNYLFHVLITRLHESELNIWIMKLYAVRTKFDIEYWKIK